MFSTGAFLSPYPGAIWAFPHLNSSLAAVSRKNPSFRISDILDVQNPSLSFPMYKLTDPLPGGAGCRTQSALGPLQAFCTSKRVHSFVSDSPRSSEQRPPKQLKFGISAILSEEFGKKSDEKGECYNSVENKQLFYAIDKVYYILISFLTMNCKLTNLIFVFFVVLIFFSFFFQTTNCWLAIPGVVLVGVRVRAFPSTPGAGCSRLRDSYPPSPPPTTL